MEKRQRIDIRAFTLIEIIVTIAILTIGALSVMTLMPATYKVVEKGTTVVRCTLAAHQVLEETSAIVRREGFLPVFDIPGVASSTTINGVNLQISYQKEDGTSYTKSQYEADRAANAAPVVLIQYVKATLGRAELSVLRYHHSG